MWLPQNTSVLIEVSSTLSFFKNPKKKKYAT